MRPAVFGERTTMRPNIESEAKYVSWYVSSFYARTRGEGSKVKASRSGCESWVLIKVAHDQRQWRPKTKKNRD